MKAVNLIPNDSRGGRVPGRASFTLAHGIIGLLAVLVIYVAVYVLTGNTINDRKAKVAQLQAEVAQTNAQAQGLSNYAAFVKLAQTRTETVKEIANTRFDWDGTLNDLARVIPSNTSLQTLVGSVAPGGASGSASGGGLRGDISAPAFELHGCTPSQDSVARLMSRLRAMSGVTRVSVEDDQQVGANAGATTPTSSASSATGNRGCPATYYNFDLVAFFTPVPNAGPFGVSSVSTVTNANPNAPAAAAATPTATTPASTPVINPITTSGGAR